MNSSHIHVRQFHQQLGMGGEQARMAHNHQSHNQHNKHCCAGQAENEGNQFHAGQVKVEIRPMTVRHNGVIERSVVGAVVQVKPRYGCNAKGRYEDGAAQADSSANDADEEARLRHSEQAEQALDAKQRETCNESNSCCCQSCADNMETDVIFSTIHNKYPPSGY